MKKLVLFSLVLVLEASVAIARGHERHHRGEQTCCQQANSENVCRDSCRVNPLFEGITLTPEQQSAINALQPNITSAQQQRVERKRQYLAQVKEILTPEQYTTFLENSFVNAGGRAGNKNIHRARMHRAHHMRQAARIVEQPAQ